MVFDLNTPVKARRVFTGSHDGKRRSANFLQWADFNSSIPAVLIDRLMPLQLTRCWVQAAEEIAAATREGEASSLRGSGQAECGRYNCGQSLGWLALRAELAEAGEEAAGCGYVLGDLGAEFFGA
jgi:hypothetical protein